MKKDIEKLKDFQKYFGKYISGNYGKKCSDFTWGCAVCQAYFVKQLFDDFVNDTVEVEKWSNKTNK